MGGLLNNSVKMENGYKLAGLATLQKHTVPYEGKQTNVGAVNSDKAKPSDAQKAKAKAKTKKILDADKNGKISDDECLVFWSVEIFDLDSNHDGKVTLEEFMAGMTKRFNEIDKNKNGYISIEEHAIFWSGKSAKK